MTGTSKRDGKEERDPQRKRTVILFWVAVIGLAITALQFAPTAIRWGGDAGGGVIHLVTGSPESSTSIVVESRVINKQPKYAAVAHHSVPTRLTAPQIDLYIRNVGADTVHLTKAKIEVIDTARVETCMPPQGGGPEEPPFELSYFVNLPVDPLPEERAVHRPLHLSVAPGSSGTVNLYLRTLESMSVTELYALRVTLSTDEDARPVDAGRFVVGLPGPIWRGGADLPEDRGSIESLYSFDTRLESTWCYRRNMAETSQFLALSGKRSPAMAALKSVQLAPNWGAYADRQPARVAAEKLLRGPYSFVDTPSLATFAAERTGDTAFANEIKRRAAAKLLRWAKEQRGHASRSAVFAARAALGFEDSPAGREVLAGAEASLRQMEDVSGELTG